VLEFICGKTDPDPACIQFTAPQRIAFTGQLDVQRFRFQRGREPTGGRSAGGLRAEAGGSEGKGGDAAGAAGTYHHRRRHGVVDGNCILGKPKDMKQATAMLKSLRGHTHQVYTALALLRMHDEQLVTELCVTQVPMRDTSDEEIEAYVLTGDPLDKAGHTPSNMRDSIPSKA